MAENIKNKVSEAIKVWIPVNRVILLLTSSQQVIKLRFVGVYVFIFLFIIYTALVNDL